MTMYAFLDTCVQFDFIFKKNIYKNIIKLNTS